MINFVFRISEKLLGKLKNEPWLFGLKNILLNLNRANPSFSFFEQFESRISISHSLQVISQ